MTRLNWILIVCLAAKADSLLVLNKDEASMVVIDPATGKITGRVLVGEGPHELVTDGKLAFASNYGTAPAPGNTISVIDLVTLRELRRVDVSPLKRPHGLFLAGGKLYFSAEANKAVGRYDPVADRIDWILGTGQDSTHMVMVSKDMKQLYTANIASNSISIFDVGERGQSQTVVPVGRGPEALDLSPDGRELWTAHSQDGGVSIIDVAAKKVTGTFSAGTKRSNRLKFTMDGKRVLITDLAAGELLVFDAATKSLVKKLTVGKSPEGILITPDGTRAYVAVNGDHYVAIVDLKKLEISGRIEPGAGPDGMAWAISPAK